MLFFVAHLYCHSAGHWGLPGRLTARIPAQWHRNVHQERTCVVPATQKHEGRAGATDLYEESSSMIAQAVSLSTTNSSNCLTITSPWFPLAIDPLRASCQQGCVFSIFLLFNIIYSYMCAYPNNSSRHPLKAIHAKLISNLVSIESTPVDWFPNNFDMTITSSPLESPNGFETLPASSTFLIRSSRTIIKMGWAEHLRSR